MPKQRFDIFLSHADADNEAAELLSDWLKALFNVEVFASSNRAGLDFHKEIHKALRACELAIVLMTPNSIHREWVHYESGAIAVREKPLIPLCAGGVVPAELPAFLQNLRACYHHSENHVNHMLSDIAHTLGKPSVPGAAADRPDIEACLGRRAAPDPAGVFKSRAEATTLIERMLHDAVAASDENDRWLRIAGVAHSDFFGTYPKFNNDLREALSNGVCVQMLFLDPSSENAVRRGIFEARRVPTVQEISNKLDMARGTRRFLQDLTGANHP